MFQLPFGKRLLRRYCVVTGVLLDNIYVVLDMFVGTQIFRGDGGGIPRNLTGYYHFVEDVVYILVVV